MLRVPQLPSSLPVVDERRLLRQMAGDLDLAREAAEVLLRGLPAQLAALDTAISTGDSVGLQRAAHRLKGAVGMFCADRACAWARHLELLGREGTTKGAPQGMVGLRVELRRMSEALDGLGGS